MIWSVEVVELIVSGQGSRFPVNRIDDLIDFILERDTPASLLISKEFKGRSIPRQDGIELSLALLDELLFRPGRDAWQTLGLPRGVDPDTVQQRFRRLMRLVHPDRAMGSPDWCQRRSSRLNQVLKEIKGGIDSAPGSESSTAAPPGARGHKARSGRQRADAVGFRPWFGESLRNTLGEPSSFQRRFFSVMIGMAVVVLMLTFYAASIDDDPMPQGPEFEASSTRESAPEPLIAAETAMDFPSPVLMEDGVHGMSEVEVALVEDDPTEESDVMQLSLGPAGKDFLDSFEPEPLDIAAIREETEPEPLDIATIREESVPEPAFSATTPLEGMAQTVPDKIDVIPVEEIAQTIIDKQADSGKREMRDQQPDDSPFTPVPDVAEVAVADEAVPTGREESPEPEAPVKLADALESQPAEETHKETRIASINACSNIDTVLGSFVDLYKQGQLQDFIALYQANAVENDARGKDAILGIYADFFQHSTNRALELQVTSQTPVSQSLCLVGGQFNARYFDATGQEQEQGGSITFYLSSYGERQIKISRVLY